MACHESCLCLVQLSTFLHSKVSSLPLPHFLTSAYLVKCVSQLASQQSPCSSNQAAAWISLPGTCAGLDSADGIMQRTLANCSALVQGPISYCSAFASHLRLHMVIGTELAANCGMYL